MKWKFELFIVLSLTTATVACAQNPPAVELTITNVGESLIEAPRLTYGQVVVDAGAQNSLPSNASADAFMEVATPARAILTWKTGVLLCRSVFEVQRSARGIKDFDTLEVAFRISGASATAVIDETPFDQAGGETQLLASSHGCK